MTNSYQFELAQDRFGLLVSARLSDAADDLPYDISERLRATRVRAVAKRKIAVTRTATSVMMSGGIGTLSYGNEPSSWWDRLAASLPLLALVLGLITINIVQDDNNVNELAEIDAALLTDDLPPAAYTDPGFAQFIKMNAGNNQ